mmetsp:Transcript_1780/g.7031  ORF Transcript_1780/g.7031 Transcript_1780/m.7031 type:complete len:106 (+) Transcript_1780:1646-1963(+)
MAVMPRRAILHECGFVRLHALAFESAGRPMSLSLSGMMFCHIVPSSEPTLSPRQVQASRWKVLSLVAREESFPSARSEPEAIGANLEHVFGADGEAEVFLGAVPS